MSKLIIKSPLEFRAEEQKAAFNKLSLGVGLLVFFLGLSSAMTYLDPMTGLRLILIDNLMRVASLPSAIGITALGIALITIFTNYFDDKKSRWLWPIRYLSLLTLGGIGFYWLLVNIANPTFDWLDLTTYGLVTVPFLSACCLIISASALLTFLYWRYHEAIVVYGVCVPGIILLNMGILVLLGYLYQVPIIYSTGMSLPISLAVILTGIILLIGTLPYRGLMLPLLSPLPKAKLMAILSFALGLGVLLLGLNSIILSLRYSAVIDAAMLSLDMRHLYTGVAMATIVVSIIMKVGGLRTTRYFTDAMYYAQQQAVSATQETLIRQIIQAAHSSLDLDEVFKKIVTVLGTFLQANCCFISRYDAEKHQLSAPTQEYRSSEQIQSLLDVAPSVWQAVNAFSNTLCQKQHPINFNAGIGLSPELQEYSAHVKVKSGLACAISYHGRCLAILFIHQVDHLRDWTETEMQVVQTVTDQIGAAIFQAELFYQKAVAEERFRLFQQGVTDYSITLEDTDGNLTSWNQGAEHIFGYRADEILGRSFFRLIPPEEFEDGSIAEKLELLRSQGHLEIEDWRIRKDGSRFWANVVLNALYNNKGQIVEIASITRDITERKRLDDALKASESRFRRLVEANIVGVLFWDIEGQIKEANQAFLQMLGYSRDELEKGLLDWHSLTPREYDWVDEAAIQRIRGQGVMEPFEKQYIAKDGHRIDVLLAVAMFEGSDREGIAFVLDISQRKKIENDLRESEERFRTMADQSPFLIALIDEAGRTTYLNRRWEEFSGKPIQALLDYGWANILHPEDRSSVLNIYHEALNKRESLSFEARFLMANGQYCWIFNAAAVRFKPNGEFAGYISSAVDVTERKLAETALIEFQKKLAESNRDLEYFATVASHDLQAPLRKIQFFCEQIYQEAKVKLSPEALDLMQRVHRSVMTAQQLVTDLLALSKVTKTGQPFRKVNVASIMDKVLVNLAEPIKSAQAQIEVALVTSLMGDPMQLEQLLQNLVENSLKYQPQGQKPVIKVYSDCSDSTFCHLIVEDNGIGIDPVYMERIFQPFERLHGKASPYPGTGIGLAICKRIVERHGGTIRVESRPGQGAKFIVRLPYKAVEKDVGVGTLLQAIE